jgi:RNA polymerase sigma-70 factor (ECF subfamily)
MGIEDISYGDQSAETTDSVQFALASISDDQREIVTMKIYGDLTFSEIAEATGLPQGTVASRYRAALVRMRELLARNEK